jgi:6-phosphogluconolactonase
LEIGNWKIEIGNWKLEMRTFIHNCNTANDLAQLFAEQMVIWMGENGGGAYHLALSGGKTPSILFSLLAEKFSKAIPWHKVHFWWGDERMVSPDDRESNFGVVNELLFKRLAIAKENIHRINGEADPEIEMERYKMEIRSLVTEAKGWPTFDLVMLGLGDDGHTASIFPNQMHLLESDQITAIATHPLSGQKRITLTGKVINNAKRVAFLVTGESKSLIYNDIINNTENSLKHPAGYIHPVGELHWFVDNKASSPG